MEGRAGKGARVSEFFFQRGVGGGRGEGGRDGGL